MPLRSRVHVSSVTVGPLADALFLGGNLDVPAPGTEECTYLLRLDGWVLHRGGDPWIELHSQGQELARLPVDQPRPDVALAFPDFPHSNVSGFSAVLNALDLPRSFEVQVTASAAGCGPATLAVVRGERSALPTRPGTPAPLIVSALGRSGTSYLMLLLGLHPQIAVPPPFPYETRTAGYWTAVLLNALSRPESYLQQLATRRTGPFWWLGDRTFRVQDYLERQDAQWLGGDGVDGAAALCAERIQASHAALAAAAGKLDARYVAEKHFPQAATAPLVGELCAGGREIVLVRDFRDMICSIDAFNARRGQALFGREAGADEDGFLELIRHSAASLARAVHRADHLVRYEDLMLDPAPALADLFRAIGVDASPEVVEQVLAASPALEAASQRAHRTTTAARESVGRWKRDLPPAFARRCERALAEVLADFRYQV